MMLRKIIVVAAALLLAAGCDKPSDKDKNIIHMTMPVANSNAKPMSGDTMYAPPPPFVPPPDILISTNAPNALFSLKHDLTVSMARDAVPARFQAARDACLKDKALKCVLTSASLTAARTVSAQLQVALPHEKVAVFENKLMQALPQDGGGRPEIKARSTSVENETVRAADADRQLAQAIAYRDKLETLAKRDNLTVEEVLKIHEALSEAQSAVENATAAKRATESDIRLEKLDLTLEEKIVPVAAFDHFWKNAGDVVVASTAEMLLRLINALPWLPIALLLAWLAARFIKRLRIRRGG